MDCTESLIYVAQNIDADQLLICAFDFAHARSRFSHDAALVMKNIDIMRLVLRKPA